MVNIDMKGKIGFITGAAEGMGAADALKLAEAGMNVVLGDMQLEKARKTAEDISLKTGNECLAVALDVTDPGMMKSAIRQCVDKFGKLDVIVNNAGIGVRGDYDKYTQAQIDKVFDVNAKGVWYGCVAAAEVMVPNHSGVIINVSSVAARMGGVGLGPYAATKAGVIAITHSLARELAPHMIRVNAVLPGHVRTPLWERTLTHLAGGNDENKKLEIFSKVLEDEQVPLHRPQDPEDIANAILFLASDMAKNVSAQIFAIDGACTIGF